MASKTSPATRAKVPRKPVSKKPISKKPASKTPEELFLGFIIDRSGSMSSCWDATISGFNEYFADQKQQASKTLVSLTLFNTDYELRHVAAPISQVQSFTQQSYVPQGNTALYDAIGRTITAIEASPNLPAKKILVILTDGQENSSREYSRQTIFDLIQAKEAAGWLFVYLGANQDSYAVGHTLGIHRGVTANYSPTAQGVTTTYHSVSTATNVMRASAKDQMGTIARDLSWSDQDHKEKKTKKSSGG